MQRGGLAVGDGSWNLAIFVTDLQVERTLRVRGDVHIGGLMIRLVDELGRKVELIECLGKFLKNVGQSLGTCDFFCQCQRGRCVFVDP